MNSRFIFRILFALAVLIPIFLSCNNSSSPTTNNQPVSTLPSIKSFLDTPSNTFILDSLGMSEIVAATPYQGEESPCPESGPHTFFASAPNEGAYTVNIYAPADGIVSKVDACADVGPDSSGGLYDRYGLNIAIGQFRGNNVDFTISMEPFGALTKPALRFPCSGNVQGHDNGYFHQYFFVTLNQTVKAGQLVAQLYVPPDSTKSQTGSGVFGAVLGWGLTKGPHDNGGSACANIFNDSIQSLFESHIQNTSCKGSDAQNPANDFPKILCWLPGPGENIVGR